MSISKMSIPPLFLPQPLWKGWLLFALLFTFHFTLFTSPTVRAISVGTTEKDTSPEAELKTFTMLDGFEISLFASELDGVNKPISIRWDERGRLWVITAKSYPQPEPGEVSDDRVLILEDTKHSGHVDKVTVFADHLRMPMGLELAPGPGNAAYVGEGEKLWLMRDTNGDGKADTKELVFSGFGTGDVHQCINSLTWTPDGALLFSQGLHNYSNVTTAWGGRRLYGAGFWTYRPLSGKLTPYPTGFPLNAWGTVYDDEGQPFSVAGAAGMFWTTPLLVSTEHLIEGRALPNNGQIVKQGMLKYCGIDIPRNAHWPQDMWGELVSGGFFENCIYRHKLQTDKENPSGYEAVRQPDLMKSSSVAFRPVDVKFGPDGALYVSDWYNPIIGHYQASFRHPDRDKTRGRIWKIVKKGSPLVKMPQLGKLSARDLLDTMLRNDNRWSSYQAQRLLMGMPGDQTIVAVRAWLTGKKEEECTASFDKLLKNKEPSEIAKIVDEWSDDFNKSDSSARKWLIGLQAGECFEKPESGLIPWMKDAKKNEMRAYAARSLGAWGQTLRDDSYGLYLLQSCVADSSPRVRLEAIAACSHIPKSESIAVALRALDKPMDSFLDRTLELTIFALAPYWEPAFREGKLQLPSKHLAYLLEKKGDGELLGPVREMLAKKSESLDPDSKRALLLMLAKRGTTEDVAAALDSGTNSHDSFLLGELATLAEAQGLKPPSNAEAAVSRMLTEADFALSKDELKDPVTGGGKMARQKAYGAGAQAMRLAGLWHLKATAETIVKIAADPKSNPEARAVSLGALARLNAGHDLILKLSADGSQPYAVRLGAVVALSLNDGTNAAKAALALMPVAKDEAEMRGLLAPFLVKAARTKLLVNALGDKPCNKESADLATRALITMGRNEPELSAVLNRILGRTAVVMPYDAQWVSSLGNEARVAGNPKKGDEIWHRPALNCIACHQIKGQGGIIGPQLDAVGRGMPIELIVEAVMWPQRQIKEGYVATTVIMKDGRTVIGYKNKESETELEIRDMASGTLTTLQKSQMQSHTEAGSLMPDGLTASLSREELRDLIAYLASLGKEK
jgi:putative heme-binding domain-containing protein